MSCHRCGGAAEPIAGPQYFAENGEVLCFECWMPELLSFLETNREAIEEQVMEILLQRMLPAVNTEIPDGATAFYYLLEEVTDESS